MQFPLSFWDISLWLAGTAIILLVTSELVSSYYGKGKILINKKNLRNAALMVGILFLVTVIIRIYGIMFSA
jgi:ABC-type nitrate/sulfonate/bicarbonate transport system permease component